MAHEFASQRRVEFAETDMAGILHFSNYYRYMEECEHAFFRSLGLSVHGRSGAGVFGWARGHAECTYRRPLRYEDVVELQLRVVDKRAKSITYEVVFRNRNADGELEEAARGRMTAVCVAQVPGEDRLRAMDMPAEVDDRVEVAPAEGSAS